MSQPANTRGREQTLTIGREPDNAICVNDPRVAARHACIRIKPDGHYLIQDLGSPTGTWVNGSRIQSCCKLHSCDRVELGGREISWTNAIEDWRATHPCLQESAKSRLWLFALVGALAVLLGVVMALGLA